MYPKAHKVVASAGKRGRQWLAGRDCRGQLVGRETVQPGNNWRSGAGLTGLDVGMRTEKLGHGQNLGFCLYH